MRTRNRFPKGWNEARVKAVLEHYESQSEDEAVAEDEAAFRRRVQAVIVVPKELVPTITKLITREATVAARTRHNKLRIVAARDVNRSPHEALARLAAEREAVMRTPGSRQSCNEAKIAACRFGSYRSEDRASAHLRTQRFGTGG